MVVRCYTDAGDDDDAAAAAADGGDDAAMASQFCPFPHRVIAGIGSS